MHVHLDHERCMEVIVLRGTGSELRQLAESLRGLKGVHTGELTLADLADLAETADAGQRQPHKHAHPHKH
jgi:CopG family nickel-responsive transcriptional regulator